MTMLDHRYLKRVMPLPDVLRIASGVHVDVDADDEVVETVEPSLRMEICLRHAIAARTAQILHARPRSRLMPGFSEQALLLVGAPS